jgi:hypothetical protein
MNCEPPAPSPPLKQPLDPLDCMQRGFVDPDRRRRPIPGIVDKDSRTGELFQFPARPLRSVGILCISQARAGILGQQQVAARRFDLAMPVISGLQPDLVEPDRKSLIDETMMKALGEREIRRDETDEAVVHVRILFRVRRRLVISRQRHEPAEHGFNGLLNARFSNRGSPR